MFEADWNIILANVCFVYANHAPAAFTHHNVEVCEEVKLFLQMFLQVTRINCFKI